MEIIKLNSLYAKIKFTKAETDMNLPKAIHERFSVYVENYFHMPAYENGQWDGKISFFNRMSNTIKLGLISEVEDWVFDNFPDVEIYGYTKELNNNINLLQLPNKDYEYYDDQEKLLIELLRHKTGVIESATGSGKSVMIAGMIHNIMKNEGIQDEIILVVPTIDLVNQMYREFKDYGLDTSIIGKVGGGSQDFKKPIIITTWQSLGSPYIKTKKGAKQTEEKKQIKEYFKYKMRICKAVIFDECHLVKSTVLNKIVENMTNVKYKVGLTGTLPTNEADLWTVLGNLGEVIGENKFMDLIELGRLADVNVKMYKINYPKEYKKSLGITDYESFIQYTIQCPIKLKLITEALKHDIATSLVLVTRIEHGKTIEEYLKANLPDREIHFLHGKLKPSYREEIIDRARNDENVIIIATIKLFSLGINIKRLKILIFGHIGKAEIPVFQSIGRTLRIYKTKVAQIVDIGSNLKYDTVHTSKRLKYYNTRLSGKVKTFIIGASK